MKQQQKERKPLYETPQAKAVGMRATCNSCDRIIFEDENWLQGYIDSGGYCKECAEEINPEISLSFAKGKDYSYSQIEQAEKTGNYTLNELGGETIGKSFIVLDHNDKDITVSFILTGYNSVTGNQYTCIYSDLK